MGFRRLKAKKYKGISEYYRDNDPDRATVAYYIDYRDIDGKRRKKKTSAKDKDEALAELNQIKSEILMQKKEISDNERELEKRIMNRNLTLDDVAMIFHEQRTNKQAKYEKNRYHTYISPVLGKMKLSKIDSKQVHMLRRSLEGKTFVRNKVIKDYKTGGQKIITEDKPLSSSTIKDILEYLRVILNWSIDEGYYKKSNPVAIKKLIDNIDDSEPGRVLTDEELEKLWTLDELKINDKLYLFMKMCYITGARPTGVINIQVKHIDFNEKKVKIMAMKKGKSYKAPINDELIKLLKVWIHKHNLKHDHYIFYPIQSYRRANSLEEKERCKRKAAKYSGYRRALQKILDPAFNQGIDSYDQMYRVTVYTMRRTAGTKIYKKYGIVHAKKFLNHTDIKTTMHYLNVDDDTEVMIDAL